MQIPRPKMGTPILCGFFVDHPCKFHTFSNALQEIPHAITSTHSHFHVFKPIVWVFYWNSLIQKDVWAITVCGSKGLNKLQTFQTFEWSQYFYPDLRSKTAYLKDFKGKKNSYS